MSSQFTSVSSLLIMPRLPVIALLLSIDAVHAHGHLTQPRPRLPLWARPSMEGFTSASSEHRMDEPTHSLLSGPVTHTGHLYESYACHDFKAELLPPSAQVLP